MSTESQAEVATRAAAALLKGPFLVLLAIAIVFTSYYVGKWQSREIDGAFDFELAALVLTGLGTTALAFATGALAYSTSSDLSVSREQLRLTKDEIARRPRLSLLPDDPRVYSAVESDNCPYIRLLVANDPDLRAASGARVLVDRFWRPDTVGMTESIGMAPLGWTSSGHEGARGDVSIFAGSSRVFDLGSLMKAGPSAPWIAGTRAPKGEWWLRLGLHGFAVDRQFLPPSAWVIRLVIGSDEADAKYYYVTVGWDPAAKSAAAALASVSIKLAEADDSTG